MTLSVPFREQRSGVWRTTTYRSIILILTGQYVETVQNTNLDRAAKTFRIIPNRNVIDTRENKISENDNRSEAKKIKKHTVEWKYTQFVVQNAYFPIKTYRRSTVSRRLFIRFLSYNFETGPQVYV